MNLADLQEEAHAIAKDHGWWDEEHSFGDLIVLVQSEALEAYRERGLEGGEEYALYWLMMSLWSTTEPVPIGTERRRCESH